MTILHIVGTPGIGGVQNFLLTLGIHDKSLNIKRNIIFLYAPNGELRQKYLDQDMEIFYCGLTLEYHGFRPYLFWKKIRKWIGSLVFPFKYYYLLIKSRADIVICNEPVKLLSQLIVCRYIGIPFVIHMHKEYDIKSKTRFLSYLLRNSYFISDSKKLTQNNLRNVKNTLYQTNNIPIIPATSNLEEISKFCYSKLEKKINSVIRIGTIGRLTWEKNFEQVINIASELKKNIKHNFIITIVGGGPDYSKLLNLIQSMGVSDVVSLVGEKGYDEIVVFYKSIDIYIQTSISEGSPLTIKEAMAASLPVVTTNISGIPDLITHGENGYLVNPDNLDIFVETLNDLICMKSKERKVIGDKAKHSILRKFSSEITANKYADYCVDLLNKYP